MTGDPCVVFGLPAYNRPDAIPRTLESLLSQTCRDIAVVVVDDSPANSVRAIVERYASGDPRLTYEANPVRLGMAGNWRRAFERSRALYPRSEYFAWASDHDVWHPRWVEVLLPLLDASASAVVAYPHGIRMYPGTRKRIEGGFDTAGIADPGTRLRKAILDMTAGNVIYGLFRATALVQAGVFRRVLLPDRQVLVQLSLLGEFRQAPEMLWYREASPAFSHARQRRTLFAGRVPFSAYVPARLQHAGVLFWDCCVRGNARPAVGRIAGAWHACASVGHEVRRDIRRWSAARRPARPAAVPQESQA